MNGLKIIKATYYVPEIGLEKGTDVTGELSAEMMSGRLVYNGIYNRIFPDRFPGIVKKLKVDIEYDGKTYSKFYPENERINLPHDLGLDSNSSGHIALNVEKSAKNNIFINSKINGSVKLSGSDNKFVNTYINPFKQKHPVWFSITSFATVIGLITGLMYLAQYAGIIPDSLKTETVADSNLSTTTPNISNLLSKALSYDTVAERQDFLSKYTNALVYGDGVINEISRSGDRFLFDITVSGVLFVCPQEKTIELEKQFYFLKGKGVRFYGTFTYSTYFGTNGLVIDNCSIEIK